MTQFKYVPKSQEAQKVIDDLKAERKKMEGVRAGRGG